VSRGGGKTLARLGTGEGRGFNRPQALSQVVPVEGNVTRPNAKTGKRRYRTSSPIIGKDRTD
jgi:hypothetical protein